MRATVWGCRGSLATPGRETLRYGGNTSCVEVRLRDGSIIVLDAGRIVAQGTHESLLRDSELYRSLAQRLSGHEVAE